MVDIVDVDLDVDLDVDVNPPRTDDDARGRDPRPASSVATTRRRADGSVVPTRGLRECLEMTLTGHGDR